MRLTEIVSQTWKREGLRGNTIIQNILIIRFQAFSKVQVLQC